MTEWPTESQQTTRWDTDPLPPSTMASSASSHASSSSTGGHVDLAEPSTGSNMIPRSGLPGPGHLCSSNNDIRLPPISSFLPPSASSSSNSSSGTAIASRESRTHSVGALTDSRVPNRASFAPSYQQRQLDATAAPSPRLPHGHHSRRPRSSEEWSTSRTAWNGPATSSSMSVSPSYQQWSTMGSTRLPALSGVGSVPPSTWKRASPTSQHSHLPRSQSSAGASPTLTSRSSCSSLGVGGSSSAHYSTASAATSAAPRQYSPAPSSYRGRPPSSHSAGPGGPNRRRWSGGPSQNAPSPYARTSPSTSIRVVESRQRRNTAPGSDRGAAPLSPGQVARLKELLEQVRSANAQRGMDSSSYLPTQSRGPNGADLVSSLKQELERLRVHDPPIAERLAQDAGMPFTHRDDPLLPYDSARSMRTSPPTPLSPELDGDYMQAHGGLLLPGHANMMDVDDDSELMRTGSLSSSGPARRQKKSQPKRVRKRENEGHQQCLGCDAIETPEWRRGPMGNRTLCNACGLLYAKQKRKKAKEAANATGQKSSAAGTEETEEEKLAALEELRAAVQAKSASLATASLPYLAQASAYGPPASSLIDAGHHLQRPLPPLPPKAASAAESYSSPVASSPSRFFPMSHQPPPPRFFEGPPSDVADRQGAAMPQIHAGRPSLPPLGTFFQPADPSRLDAPLPLLPHEKSGGLSGPSLGPPPPPPRFHRSHSATTSADSHNNSPISQSAPFAPLHNAPSATATLGLASPTAAASRLSIRSGHTPTPPSSAKNRASQFFDKLNPLSHFSHRETAPSSPSNLSNVNSRDSSLHHTSAMHHSLSSSSSSSSFSAFDNERANTSNGGAGLPPPAIWASRRQL